MKHRIANTILSLAALVISIVAMADPCSVESPKSEAAATVNP